MSDDLAGLRSGQLRDALGLLGGTPSREAPAGRPQTARELRKLLREPGLVRSVLARGPEGAREAFTTLATEGPRSVQALLGRSWWGRGMLPPPLDWLQQRALVVVDDAGLVHAVEAAVEGWRTQRLDLGADAGAQPPPEEGEVAQPADGPQQPSLVAAANVEGRPAEPLGPQPVSIEGAASVVIAAQPEDLDRVMGIRTAGLRAVAPTVAVSRLRPDRLAEVLRAEGVSLRSDAQVRAQPDEPALPFNAERAVTPWDLRALFGRALQDGRQIHLVYFPSSRGGAATERTVDPWDFADDLLTGYCHLREGQRTFALDRVGAATLLPSPIEHPPAPD